MVHANSNLIIFLRELDNDSLLDLWNDYQDRINSSEQICTNDEESWRVLEGDDVLDFFRDYSNGVFDGWNFQDDYLLVTDLGHWETSNNVEDLIEISGLADYLANHPSDIEDDFTEAFWDNMPNGAADDDRIVEYIEQECDIYTDEWDELSQEIGRMMDEITKEDE